MNPVVVCLHVEMHNFCKLHAKHDQTAHLTSVPHNNLPLPLYKLLCLFLYH